MDRIKVFLLVVLLVASASVTAGCLGGSGGEEGSDWEGFMLVEEGTGLETHRVGKHLPQRGHMMLTLLGSIAVADVDGDGWEDVFVGDEGPSRLFRNDGDGTFTDVMDRTGMDASLNTKYAVWFDYDGDGDRDLFQANWKEPSKLYRNDGNWSFTDVTEEAGFGATTLAYAAGVADVDGDGDLDVSVGNYGEWETGPSSFTGATNGGRDLLYINQGNGSFKEVARERGIDATRWTFSHAWGDFDGDGDQDLYMNVDFGEDVLYVNDGSGNFTVETEARGVASNRNGMGAHWVDVDNDLDLDLFQTNIHLSDDHHLDVFRGNRLFINDGAGSFSGEAVERGISDGGWGWDSDWVDYDHDGDQDAFQANGMLTMGPVDYYDDSDFYLLDEKPDRRPRHHVLSQPWNASKWMVAELHEEHRPLNTPPSVGGHEVDRFFLNDGSGSFREVGEEVGIPGISDSRALASLDIDHDGDLDVIRGSLNLPLVLFENTAVQDGGTPEDRRWLQVELVGEAPNTDAIGARMEAHVGDATMLRIQRASGGFMSQSQHALHLGLGSADSVDRLVVTWPDGSEEVFEDVEGDRRVRIVQGQGTVEEVWS